jgi:mannose-6-phosphate isomerase-like protein (cupin superfamily)
MKQKIKRILLWTMLGAAGYFIVGIVFSHYLFPPKKPDYNSYFKPGDRFHSDWEGFEQTILAEKDGWIHGSLKIRPKASGPPVHLHTSFDETFVVKTGVLSVLVNGEKKTVRAGEQLTVRAGTPHKPFNETDFPIVVEDAGSDKTMPVEFAYHLSQLYGFINDSGEHPGDLPMLLQMSVYGDDMDAWLADAPPVSVQRAMRFLIAPTARLLGYKNYYEQYRHGKTPSYGADDE